ncbi:DnaB-like helicase C-terminal domain-containing protein [Streptomyces graminilatus]|uniref:DnaB-like helicase C-terminal domain-containing protein n=1 Tax=Streptomyces graminilatus TaxID=1464070 RepID=UPI0012FF5487|nr:DnaB-like helicase C-terminal domain-containing protein [Streptomyces graminilatus]
MPSSANPDPDAPASHGGEAGPPPRETAGLGETVQAVLAGQERLSTSVSALDAALGGGLHPGRLYLVVGDQEAGVGLLPTGAARAAVFDDGRGVLYGACGPSRQDIAARVMASHLDIDYIALRDGKLEEPDHAAVTELSAQPAAALLRIDDGPNLDAGVLAGLAGNVPGLALVVVDRLHATRDPRRPMSGQAGIVETVQALTHLARAREVAVLTVLDTDDSDLLTELDADVTVTLRRTWGGWRAEVAERDVGTVAEAAFEVDAARARLTDLPTPPFHPGHAFGDEDGRQATARLVEAAGAFTDRPEELPMGLRQDLRSLVSNAERSSGGWDPGGRLGGLQLAVLRDWTSRPEMPDTDDGRCLETALDAFLEHALVHGYVPVEASNAA